MIGNETTFDDIRLDQSEVLSKIPEYFYQAFLGELVSVFGTYILNKETIDVSGLNSGTAGWVFAFYQTCEKLDLGWMRKHRDSLVWYDADYFDGAIEEKCIEFCSKEARETHNGDYFQFLLDKYD